MLNKAKERSIAQDDVDKQMTAMFGAVVIDNMTREQMSKIYDWVVGYEVDH